MKKFGLILTSDYEVWGNGSGCVENCIIEPTENMLAIADKYGARLTFFLDVCEYWAFEKIESAGKFSGTYTPASIIKKQLQDAVRAGHDVQLHFHPQWLNYEFIANQTWKLDFRYWRLPEVDNYYNGDWSVEKLFQEGVRTLENLIRPVKPEYKVRVFRAGAWNIQPEENILKAMKKTGISLDTSVAPGRKDFCAPNQYDFTGSPELPYWECGSMINEEGSGGPMELPICTAQLNPVEKLIYSAYKIKYRNNIKARNCKKESDQMNSRPDATEKIRRRLFQPSMLNFSDGTSFRELKRITELVMKKYGSFKSDWIPMVAISHPKTFGVTGEFEKYLSWVKEKENMVFSDFSDFEKRYKA